MGICSVVFLIVNGGLGGVVHFGGYGLGIWNEKRDIAHLFMLVLAFFRYPFLIVLKFFGEYGSARGSVGENIRKEGGAYKLRKLRSWSPDKKWRSAQSRATRTAWTGCEGSRIDPYHVQHHDPAGGRGEAHQ